MEIILNNIMFWKQAWKDGADAVSETKCGTNFIISNISNFKKVHGINEFRETCYFINGYVVGMAVTVMASTLHYITYSFHQSIFCVNRVWI